MIGPFLKRLTDFYVEECPIETVISKNSQNESLRCYFFYPAVSYVLYYRYLTRPVEFISLILQSPIYTK